MKHFFNIKIFVGAAVAEWSKAYVLYCSYIPLRRSWVRFPLGEFSVMVFSWLERILTGMKSRYNVKSHVKKATKCRLIIQNILDKKLVGGILSIGNHTEKTVAELSLVSSRWIITACSGSHQL